MKCLSLVINESSKNELVELMRRLPEDYEPWGLVKRWADPHKPYPDCSSGCKWARWLEDLKTESLGGDWCVCTNPKSHRCGLLTFEHQGCVQGECVELDEEDEP